MNSILMKDFDSKCLIRGMILYFIQLSIMILLVGCSAQTPNKVVITDATIVDIENNELIENQSIYIHNGHIEKISTSKDVFNKSYTMINANGKYVIPGLIDSHVHTTAGREEDMLLSLKQTLKGGITTVRDMGGDAIVIKKWQSEESDKIPTILTSAVFAGESWMKADPRAEASSHGKKAGHIPWMRSINRKDSINEYILAAKRFGVDGIKIYADLSSVMVSAIAQTAKENDLNVWSHSTIFPIGPVEAINSGVEVVSHVERLLCVLDTSLSATYHADRYVERSYQRSQLNSEKIDQLISLMKEKRVYLDATLSISKLKAERSNNVSQLDLIYEFTSQLSKAGVLLLAGTDAMADRQTGRPNLHEELRLLVDKCGLAANEALKTATINPAVAFNLDAKGKIEVNYLADILILNSNPLEDISNTRDIHAVIKSGKIIE